MKKNKVKIVQTQGFEKMNLVALSTEINDYIDYLHGDHFDMYCDIRSIEYSSHTVQEGIVHTALLVYEREYEIEEADGN